MKTTLILLLSLALATEVLNSPLESARPRALCNNDPNAYSPCFCDDVNGQFTVTCTDISDPSVITAAFRSSPTLQHNTFNLFDQDFSIVPSYLIGDARARNIQIRCSGRRLTSIDPNAFRSTESFTTYFGIDDCDIDTSLINFNFLDRFSLLSEFVLTRSPLLTFRGFPFLPSLRSVNLQQVSGLLGWFSAPPNSVLENVVVRDMADQNVIVTILNTLTAYNDSLRAVNFQNTNLVNIPAGIKPMGMLKELHLGDNALFRIPAGSLATEAKLTYFSLRNNRLSELNFDTGAFASDFSETRIDLHGNNFRILSYETFGQVLNSMTTGSLYLHDSDAAFDQGNLVDCDCNLAWLIRDCPSLLTKVKFGYCSNGTRFEDLNPLGTPIGSCPVQCDLEATPPPPTGDLRHFK